MRFKNEAIFFSPSDLITFLESPFASHMERLLLEDKSQSILLDPKDAMLKNLQKKGYYILRYTGSFKITKKLANELNCQFYLFNNIEIIHIQYSKAIFF